MKNIVVAVGVIVRDGKILLAQRNSPARPDAHNKWEFPGGKNEDEETLEQTIIRELYEELGVTVTPTMLPVNFQHTWVVNDEPVHTLLFVFRCITDQKPRIVADKHNALKWVTPKEALDMDLLPAVAKILAYVTL